MEELTPLEQIQRQVHRYFVAVHGVGYVYRAPETFPNAIEQWMLALRTSNMEEANNCIVNIEDHFKSVRS